MNTSRPKLHGCRQSGGRRRVIQGKKCSDDPYGDIDYQVDLHPSVWLIGAEIQTVHMKSLHLPSLSLLSILAAVSPIHGATTLGVSDIMFTGFSSEGPTEDFSIVTFVTIEAGTVVYFSDRAWDGSAFDTSNSLADGEIVWSITSDILPGTSVVFNMDSTNSYVASATSGNASGGFGTASGLSAGGETIFAYQGGSGSPSFVHGLNYRGVYETPTSGDTLDSLRPSALGVTNGDVVFNPHIDNGSFTDRSSQSSLADYKALISDPANWTTSNDDLALSSGSFTVVPEPSASILTGISVIALAFVRRRV